MLSDARSLYIHNPDPIHQVESFRSMMSNWEEVISYGVWNYHLEKLEPFIKNLQASALFESIRNRPNYVLYYLGSEEMKKVEADTLKEVDDLFAKIIAGVETICNGEIAFCFKLEAKHVAANSYPACLWLHNKGTKPKLVTIHEIQEMWRDREGEGTYCINLKDLNLTFGMGRDTGKYFDEYYYNKDHQPS